MNQRQAYLSNRESSADFSSPNIDASVYWGPLVWPVMPLLLGVFLLLSICGVKPFVSIFIFIPLVAFSLLTSLQDIGRIQVYLARKGEGYVD
jgi:hypothetical protein